MIHPSPGGKKHWLQIVDEATGHTHSFFLKKKRDLVETMIIWIETFFLVISYQDQDNQIGQQWRKQNAQSKIKSSNLGIKFENSVVE